MAITWTKVEERIGDAHSIAFDGCHKIYLNMDAEQTRQTESYGYNEDGSQMRYAADRTRGELLGILHEWFDESCGLRFINAVSTVDGDPNDGFETLIGQFDEDDEDEGYYCADCGTEISDAFDDYCDRCQAERDAEDEDEDTV